MHIRIARLAAAMLLVTATAAADLAAQTDYYNTDAGRPVRIEDAHPTERYAFELQLAPLRLERERGGVYNWGIEPEIAYGILPRTHLEVGFPYAYVDQPGGRTSGLAGIDVSLLHNLNMETRTLPAFGVAADIVLPVGSLAPGRAFIAGKAIATRTFGFARIHANASYTFGSSTSDEVGAEELSRWLGGIAIDRTMPLRALLVIGEVYARQPIDSDDDTEWNAGAGVRYQLSPRLALDGGVGKRLSGDDTGWYFTFGSAYAFALRSLMPIR